MNDAIRGWFVDVGTGVSEPCMFRSDLQEVYDLLDCDCIDMAYRYVGGRRFAFIVDDEGLLKDSPRISAVDVHGEPALVGNLLIAGIAGHELRSLTDEEVGVLRENTCCLLIKGFDEVYNVNALINIAYSAEECA